MAEGTDTDPATLGDADLLGRVHESADPIHTAELRRRHLHGLTTVAAGYVRADGGSGEGPDPESIVDTVFADIADVRVPTGDGEVFLTLCLQVREQVLGRSTGDGSPQSLVDLIDVSRLEGTPGVADVVAAYGSLDERDRVLLWFLAVEGTLPNQLAARLSIGGGDLAATMTHRARRALRRAYVDLCTAGTHPTAACAPTLHRLVSLVGEPTGEDRAHLETCDHCRSIAADLHALPTQLTVAVASIRADTPRPEAAPATSRVAATAGPVVITTTPMLDDAPTAALAATTVGAPADPDVPAALTDDDARPRRRLGAVVTVAVVLVVLAVAAAVWLVPDRTPERPVSPGVEVGPSASLAGTTSTSTTPPSTSTTSSTTSTSTSSTSTSVPTTAPPEPEPEPTPPPVPAPVPPSPPRTVTPPSTAVPTTARPIPTTTPPSTSPPTTSAPTTTPPPTDPGPDIGGP